MICTHNGSARIARALQCLAAQDCDDSVSWEVVIVDNASADETAATARRAWDAVEKAPLRVVMEPQLGLAAARRRGLAEAGFEIVSFIDDDNLVAENWVRAVAETFARHPEAGACGGLNTAKLEEPAPVWFGGYRGSYAVGAQVPQDGGVYPTADREGGAARECTTLWGAGLSLRGSAWSALEDAGFRSLLKGRTGRSLAAGEDTEFCLALRLAGWRLLYQPDMQLAHALPVRRLTWRYLRHLRRNFGASTTAFDPYRVALEHSADPVTGRWWLEVVYGVGELLRAWRAVGRALLTLGEGRHDVLSVERAWGRLVALLRLRRAYDRSFCEVRELRRALTGS